MHISSLPGPDGIGSLGKEAYEFADFLHASGLNIWQVLPMGPTGYGESPYQSTSVYAGNPLFISLEKLEEQGLVDLSDELRYIPNNPEKVDYSATRTSKFRLLRLAFEQSREKLQSQIDAFVTANKWAEDFALFTALKEHFGGRMWSQWPDAGAKNRQLKALAAYEVSLDEDVRFHVWCQYVFDQQWMALKKYCNDLGIKLFGDMPIYVAEDSADTWTNPQVFQLDKDRVPKRVAGVPPDYFCEDGQLWGNPLYRWFYLRLRGYDWWVDRMKHMNRMYDIVRVDHFIGFANYYSIPHGAPNARNGKWVIGPGKALFVTLNRKIPGMEIVAEDLGVVSDRVRKLIAFTGYPGMKVATFAFDGEKDNIHLPENFTENTAYYTGTHDNATTMAWAESIGEAELKRAMEAADFKTKEEAPWAMIRFVFRSKARIAVTPMQDVLGLGAWSTMNHPGLMGDNWLWRMKPGAATPEIAAKFKKLVEESDRR